MLFYLFIYYACFTTGIGIGIKGKDKSTASCVSTSHFSCLADSEGADAWAPVRSAAAHISRKLMADEYLNKSSMLSRKLSALTQGEKDAIILESLKKNPKKRNKSKPVIGGALDPHVSYRNQSHTAYNR